MEALARIAEKYSPIPIGKKEEVWEYLINIERMDLWIKIIVITILQIRGFYDSHNKYLSWWRNQKELEITYYFNVWWGWSGWILLKYIMLVLRMDYQYHKYKLL